MYNETILSYYLYNPSEFTSDLLNYYKIFIDTNHYKYLSQINAIETTLLKQQYQKEFNLLPQKEVHNLDIGLYTEQLIDKILPNILLNKNSDKIRYIMDILNNSPLNNKREELSSFNESRRVEELEKRNKELMNNTSANLLFFPETLSEVHTLVPFLELPKFITIGADPGDGKSALLFQCADGFAQKGHNVLLFDNELAESDFFRRELAYYSGITINDQLDHILNKQQDRTISEKLKFAQEQITNKKGKINFISCIGWNIDQIINYIYKHRNDYDIVIMDQINRISGTAEKREAVIADGVVKLKEVTARLKMLCLMAAQFTKSMQGQVNRDLSALFGTVEINNVSNVGIILEGVKFKESPNGLFNKKFLNIVKCNGGKLGQIPVAFMGAKFKFADKTYMDKTPYKGVL